MLRNKNRPNECQDGNCMRNQLTNPGEPIRDVYIYIGWIRTVCKMGHKYYTNVIGQLSKH